MRRLSRLVRRFRHYVIALLIGAAIGVFVFALSVPTDVGAIPGQAIDQHLSWWPRTAMGAAVVLLSAFIGALMGTSRVRSGVVALSVSTTAVLAMFLVPYVLAFFQTHYSLWAVPLVLSLVGFLELGTLAFLFALLMHLSKAKLRLRVLVAILGSTVIATAFVLWNVHAAKSTQVSAEEYEVYSAVLQETFPSARTIVVYDHTVTPSGTWHPYVSWTSSLAAPFAVSDFQAKNHGEYLLGPMFHHPARQVLLSEQQSRDAFARGWGGFYKLYPDAPGMICFSRVGMDPISQTAVVYVGSQSGGLAGEGNLVILSKLSGKWRIQRRIMQWIS